MLSPRRFPIVLCILLAATALIDGSHAGKKKRVQPVDIVPGLAAGPITIDSVNAEWADRRCQIRVPMTITKDKEKGWYKSHWAIAPTLPGQRPHEFRLWVSDREQLIREGYLSRKKDLRPGTMFIVDGWTLENAAKERGVRLELRFADIPVRAVMEFKNGDKLEDLEDLERLCRIELFQLLQGGGVAPQATAASADAGYVPAAGSGEPKLNLLGASVDPTSVAAGEQVELIIHYEISGGTADVVEFRHLIQEDRLLTTFEEPLSRPVGTYASSQTINIPADQAPGVYTLKVEVVLDGETSEATALFQIH